MLVSLHENNQHKITATGQQYIFGLMSRFTRLVNNKFQAIARAVASNPILIFIVSFLTILSATAFVQTGQHREPPGWNSEGNVPFRSWVTDITQWIIRTDLSPPQQAAAIAQCLEGTARDMARTLTPDEIMNGGEINGEPVDAVTYLLVHLREEFCQLDHEQRIAAMTQFFAFSRKQGEPINSF